MLPWHENIALTLGMIGSEIAVEPLIDYTLQGAGGEISEAAGAAATRQAFKGRVGSIIALGYLLNQTGNEAALAFLQDSASPAAWQTRGISGLPMQGEDQASTSRDQSKYAIISLGLSGNPDATAALLQLKEDGAQPSLGPGSEGFDDIIEQSLQLSEEITSKGLLEYYSPDGN
jgi:hypothetical protein